MAVSPENQQLGPMLVHVIEKRLGPRRAARRQLFNGYGRAVPTQVQRDVGTGLLTMTPILMRVDEQHGHGASRDENRHRVAYRLSCLAGRVPADDDVLADGLTRPGVRDDEQGPTALEQNPLRRHVLWQAIRCRMPDDDQIGLEGVEDRRLLRLGAPDTAKLPGDFQS